MSMCIDVLSKKEVAALGADLSENNEYICETAGFVPLEVKMRQFEQNGIIAQFQVSDFDSNDYRDIYLNPDFNIYPDDDLEDVQEKLEARKQYIDELKKSKSNGQNVKAGTEEHENKSPDGEDNKDASKDA